MQTLFFFDVRLGSDPADEDMDGVQFADLEEAEREGLIAAVEMAKDRFSREPGALSIDVRDETGVRSTIAVTMTVCRRD